MPIDVALPPESHRATERSIHLGDLRLWQREDAVLRAKPDATRFFRGPLDAARPRRKRRHDPAGGLLDKGRALQTQSGAVGNHRRRMMMPDDLDATRRIDRAMAVVKIKVVRLPRLDHLHVAA